MRMSINHLLIEIKMNIVHTSDLAQDIQWAQEDYCTEYPSDSAQVEALLIEWLKMMELLVQMKVKIEIFYTINFWDHEKEEALGAVQWIIWHYLDTQ